jgi:hypothetical protein
MMRLSEAMRLGAMIRGQAFGVLFNPLPLRAGEALPPEATSCAMGAAVEAIGERCVQDAPRDWCPLLNIVIRCPECGQRGHASLNGSVIEMIVALNNEHRWTREKIAAWVESIELRVLGPAAEGAQQTTIDAGARDLVCV